MSDLERTSALRIIDANANRLVEGLRVVEDYLRFHRNDAHLSHETKSLRHQVSQTLANHFSTRAFARSTSTDVGTSNQTVAEYERLSLGHVVRANIRRCTEALRTLEEYSKLFASEPAKEFEQIRYRTYTLEQCLGHLDRSLAALQHAKLYVLVDLRYGFDEQFADRVHAMLEAGVQILQLRDKRATDRELIQAGKLLRSAVGAANSSEQSGDRALFIMNDRPDLACIVNADGVHVGQDEATVAEARSVVGADRLVGVSTHSLAQAQAAVMAGADYIGVGPVFPSETKEFDEFVGTELVRSVTSEISLPSFAIGGITPDNLATVVDSGAERVAVSESIWGAADMKQAVARFASLWKD